MALGLVVQDFGFFRTKIQLLYAIEQQISTAFEAAQVVKR